MKTSKRWLLITLLLSQLLFCTPQKHTPIPEATAKTPLTPIRIAYSVKDGVGGAGEIGEIMRRTNLLERYNLSGDFSAVDGIPDITNLLIEEKADIVITVPGGVQNIGYSASPYTVIAFLGNGNNTLVVPAESPIKSIKELKGKTIESVYTTSYLNHIFATYQLTTDDLKIIRVYKTPNQMLASLQNGTIDAATFWDPYCKYYQQKGLIRILDGAWYSPLITVNKKFISQNRAAVINFLSALKEAVLFALNNQELVHQWYADISGIDYEIIREIENCPDLYQRDKNISNIEAVDLQQVWTGRYSHMAGILLKYFYDQKSYPLANRIVWQKAKRLGEYIDSNYYTPDIDYYLSSELLDEMEISKPYQRIKTPVKLKEPLPNLDIEATRALLDNTNPGIKLKGIDAIIRHKDHRFDSQIIVLLEDNHPDVRARACRAVTRLRIKNTEETLKTLLNDDSHIVRQEAVQAAIIINPAKFKDKALKLLSDPNPLVRQTLINVIAFSYPKNNVITQELIKLLNDPDPIVRWDALRILVTVYNHPESIRLLNECYEKIGGPIRMEVDRLIAICSLLTDDELIKLENIWGKITKDNSLFTQKIIPLLLRLPADKSAFYLNTILSHPWYDARVAGIYGLLKLHRMHPDKVKNIMESSLLKLLKDPDYLVRRSVLELIGQYKMADFIPDVVAALQDTNYEVRAAAINTIGQLDIKTSAPALIACLTDSEPLIQQMSIRTLVRLKIKEALPGIEKLSDNTNELTKQMSIWAIKELK